MACSWGGSRRHRDGHLVLHQIRAGSRRGAIPSHRPPPSAPSPADRHRPRLDSSSASIDGRRRVRGSPSSARLHFFEAADDFLALALALRPSRRRSKNPNQNSPVPGPESQRPSNPATQQPSSPNSARCWLQHQFVERCLRILGEQLANLRRNRQLHIVSRRERQRPLPVVRHPRPPSSSPRGRPPTARPLASSIPTPRLRLSAPGHVRTTFAKACLHAWRQRHCAICCISARPRVMRPASALCPRPSPSTSCDGDDVERTADLHTHDVIGAIQSQ